MINMTHEEYTEKYKKVYEQNKTNLENMIFPVGMQHWQVRVFVNAYSDYSNFEKLYEQLKHYAKYSNTPHALRLIQNAFLEPELGDAHTLYKKWFDNPRMILKNVIENYEEDSEDCTDVESNMEKLANEYAVLRCTQMAQELMVDTQFNLEDYLDKFFKTNKMI